MQMSRTLNVVMESEGQQLSVLDRLVQEHGIAKATRLYGFIVMFVQLGEDGVREKLAQRTYDRYLQEVRQAGINPWLCQIYFPKGWRGSFARWVYERQRRFLKRS